MRQKEIYPLYSLLSSRAIVCDIVMWCDVYFFIFDCRVTYKHGKNVSIGGLVATRRESYNCGIIVSDASLRDDMLFQVMECLQDEHIYTYVVH